MLLWPKKMLEITSILSHLLRFVCSLKECVFYFFLNVIFWKYQLSLTVESFKISVALSILCLEDLPFDINETDLLVLLYFCWFLPLCLSIFVFCIWILLYWVHWKRKWQPTPVFLPGESQGRGTLAGCRLWGHTELDTTEVT